MKGGVSEMKGRRVFQGQDSPLEGEDQSRWRGSRGAEKAGLQRNERENRRTEPDIANPAAGEF